MSLRLRATLLVLLLALAAPVQAAPQGEKQPARKTLRVGVTGGSPFAFSTAAGYDGISVRLWCAVAKHLHVDYELLQVATPDMVIERIANGDLDVGVGTIAVTSARARRVHYTQPYFTSSVVAATRPSRSSVFDQAVPYLTVAVLFACLLVAVLFVVGNLIWLFERHYGDEHFPRAWVPGVGKGMWLAIVTLTAVGYGDVVPRTGWGRMVAAVWMLICFLFASTLTAWIASWLTHYKMTHGAIRSPEELFNLRTAVVVGTVPADFARRFGAQRILCKDMGEAMALLEKQSVKAVVGYGSEITYYLNRFPEVHLHLSPPLERENLGFVLRRGDPLSYDIDEALLVLKETDATHAIVDEFISQGASSDDAVR